MHILFLTQVLPYPLDAGPKVRAYYVLRYLAQHHAITLVSFVRPSDSAEALGHLAQFCAGVYTTSMPRQRWRDAGHLLRSLPSPTPFLIARDEVRAMRTLLAQVIAGQPAFDAIHADQLWMAPYARLAQALGCGPRRPRLTLDQHNAVFMIPQRMGQDAGNPAKRLLLAWEARKLARYEIETCHAFDDVVWVTADDYTAVQRQANSSAGAVRNSGVIPICVDASAAAMRRRAPAPRITFLGGLHYPPNAEGVLWFAKEVFPAVRAACPQAILTVIGKQPPPELAQMGIPAANLEVTGYVADPSPYLQETGAFMVPLRAGGGMRVKILDAWRWGLPIVSTTVGAEGLAARSGDNLLIADDARSFAAATIRLLGDAPEGARLAAAGRQTLAQRYDWRTVYPLWDRMYPV
ncbi:MAG: glycosyltransferase [Caldilineaceae bacterium]|nr:glycosyltransferase [Caldilineaceae bacterium]